MNSKQQAKEQAEANLESIRDIIKKFQDAKSAPDRDDIRKRIHEMPLGVKVSGNALAGKDIEPERYTITLTTGGPHVELIGDLDAKQGRPANAKLKAYSHNEEVARHGNPKNDKLLKFARMFYFG